MDSFLGRVKRTIMSHGLVGAGDVVVVSVSGGADSVALLLALHLLRDELVISPRVLHVNHGLRGEESDREQVFVAELAGRLEVPYGAVRLDLAAEAIQGGRTSLQELAREARYRVLEEAAYRWRASRIAVGHNADDQAETLLENLLRGSGTEGLSGIPYRRGKIIRPLLDLTRGEIEEFLRRCGEDFCTDSSNLKPVYLRNRVRLELMPLLREFNPNLVETLNRTAEIMRDDGELLDWMATTAAVEMGILFNEDRVRVPAAKLLAQPRALQRRVLRQALSRLLGGLRGVRYQHVASLMELAANPESGREIHLSRELQGRREYEWLVLERRRTREGVGHWEHRLSVPGRTYLPELEAAIEAEVIEGGPQEAGIDKTGGRGRAVLDMDRVESPIFARRRRPGDRFHPLGAGGSQKVKEFFIDHKVPREARDRTAVVGAGDAVYWLAGYRVDSRYAADARTHRCLVLTLSK